jgi:hypothetical protein
MYSQALRTLFRFFDGCTPLDVTAVAFRSGTPGRSYVQEFIKTQFAGVQIHIDVLKILKAVAPYFRHLEVEDEGEWWGTENTSILTEHFSRSQQAIEWEWRMTPSAKMKVKTPSGRIMDLVT